MSSMHVAEQVDGEVILFQLLDKLGQSSTIWSERYVCVTEVHLSIYRRAKEGEDAHLYCLNTDGSQIAVLESDSIYLESVTAVEQLPQQPSSTRFEFVVFYDAGSSKVDSFSLSAHSEHQRQEWMDTIRACSAPVPPPSTAAEPLPVLTDIAPPSLPPAVAALPVPVDSVVESAVAPVVPVSSEVIVAPLVEAAPTPESPKKSVKPIRTVHSDHYISCMSAGEGQHLLRVTPKMTAEEIGAIGTGKLVSVVSVKKVPVAVGEQLWGQLLEPLSLEQLYLPEYEGQAWVCLQDERGTQFFKKVTTPFVFRSAIPKGAGFHNIRTAPAFDAPILGEVPAGHVVGVSEIGLVGSASLSARAEPVAKVPAGPSVKGSVSVQQKVASLLSNKSFTSPLHSSWLKLAPDSLATFCRTEEGASPAAGYVCCISPSGVPFFTDMTLPDTIAN